jgi:hypothetical protein
MIIALLSSCENNVKHVNCDVFMLFPSEIKIKIKRETDVKSKHE